MTESHLMHQSRKKPITQNHQ